MTSAPIDIKRNIREALRDEHLRSTVRKAMDHSMRKRAEAVAEVSSWEKLRDAASHVRGYTMEHLGDYLEQFERSALSNGFCVHWARDGDEAVRIIRRLLSEHGAHSVVKSKSMVTEEIHLNAALERDGLSVVETDLGEYVVQLAGQTPSHITAPALHLSREDVGALLTEKLHEEVSSDPALMTPVVRRVLREKFLGADAGISGVNFAVAETGTICIVENEGNARLSTTLPPLHIAVTGIEKVIPRMADLPLFLKLLSRSATGQKMASYVSLISSPRQKEEKDGPEEVHVVLLDNGRSALLRDSVMQQILHCIRCGACLNTCPVYRNVGGHAYGWTYSGPIGAILAPGFLGLDAAHDHPCASSVCGACAEVCPVKIDIHHVLLYQRSLIAERKTTPLAERMVFKLWGWAMSGRRRYAVATRLAQIAGRLLRRDGKLNIPVWGASRDFPTVAPRTFHQLYRTRRG